MVHLKGKLLLLVTFDAAYIQSFLFFEKVLSPFKKLIQSLFLLLSVFHGVIFFILLSLSKVIGSSTTTSEDNFLTLLRPTYVMPNVCSDFPILTSAFGKVNPWLLWIVRANASLSGSCCLS